MSGLTWAEWTGAAFGIVGAVLVAANVAISKWGFILFLISNLLIGVYAWFANASGVLVMQIVYALINVVGVWRWMYGGSNGVPAVKVEQNSEVERL